MPKFYFTFGLDSENQDYKGGWALVVAQDRGDAVNAFNVFHPKTPGGFLACAFVYSEQEFRRIGIRDNFGHGTRENIVVNHKLQQLSPDDYCDTVSYSRRVIDAS